MSSAPTGIGSQPGIYVLRGPCGSWLASDGAVAVCQAERRDVIGSNRYWVTVRDLCAARALWELACQRWGSCGLSGSAQGCHRRQAGSHRYCVTVRDLCAARALWELACQRWSSCGLSGRAPQASSPMDRERVKTPSASRCCFCVQPLWAHRRNNPDAGQSVGGCGKYPGAFRKWCTCATCDPGTGSRYCSCAAG